jgi:carbonic anhydrase
MDDEEGKKQVIKSMLEGNKKFARSRKWHNQRRSLISGQQPMTIVVCCSDSRVPPEIVFDQIKLGEIFVVRTAGHVLDTASIESIQFALDHLKCDSIVVLGHQNCGAVTSIWSNFASQNSNDDKHSTHYDDNFLHHGKRFSFQARENQEKQDQHHQKNQDLDAQWGARGAKPSYPRIEKYIGKSLCNDSKLSDDENIANSIKKNAIRTAKLIVKNTGIDSSRVHPSYYNIKTGHVDLLGGPRPP